MFKKDIQPIFTDLREHIPLKQGLRLPIIVILLLHLSMTQRAYSIKTRIKTMSIDFIALSVSVLREHIPLKQGLRRSVFQLL